MIAAGMFVALCMQYFAGGAAAVGKSSVAAGAREPSDILGYCSGPINAYEYSTVDELYEGTQGKLLSPPEAGKASPAEIATAKADAVLLAWVSADPDPSAIEALLSQSSFRYLLLMRKIFSKGNVMRFLSSNRALRLCFMPEHCEAIRLSVDRAAKIQEVVDTKITFYFDSLYAREFFTARQAQVLEMPYDIFVYLYARAHHRNESVVDEVLILLRRWLHNNTPHDFFKEYTLPFIKEMLAHDFVGSNANFELEKAVVQRAAALHRGFTLSIFEELDFRTPHFKLFEECVSKYPSYVHPVFIQYYLYFCTKAGVINDDKKASILRHYFKNDSYFRERLDEMTSDRYVIDKLMAKFLCPWIFEQFVSKKALYSDRRTLLRRVIDRIPMAKTWGILVAAHNCGYSARIPFFLSMLSREYLAEFYEHVCSQQHNERYKNDYHLVEKYQLASPPEMLPADAAKALLEP
ncbi:hypothetical protein PAPHI01_1888 [Pancytospora philotis]|nr:hypothetical protein PAPHI01_1888 [Pancytospora philotis]